MIELNPLDVLNKRTLSWCPPHFSKITVTHHVFDSSLEDWIKYKLKGRYCLLPSTNNSSSILGFEEEKELTFFMLACPHFRRN